MELPVLCTLVTGSKVEHTGAVGIDVSTFDQFPWSEVTVTETSKDALRLC
jgi:hypothetical protein